MEIPSPGCGTNLVLYKSQFSKLPENVSKLLQASCTDSTWTRYNCYLRKFEEYCNRNNLSFTNPCISTILGFLTSLYEAKLGYSSINTARCALSSFFGKIDNVQLGEHPLVKRLLKGVTKLNPPLPKYKTTWDVDSILELYKGWPDNSEIDLFNLSLKLCSMLALISGQRSQTLVAIKIEEIIIETNVIKIPVSKQLKTSAVGISQPCIHIPRKHRQKKLCVASTLIEYLSRTRPLREGVSQLFITTIKPYRPVTSQTLSHWLVKVLSLAEIDTRIYKGHSFRHASTSKAFSVGVNVSSIYENAGWTSKSKVFFKFYNKEIKNVNDKLQFASSVMRY